MEPLSFKEFEVDVLEATSKLIENFDLQIVHLDKYQIYAGNSKAAIWFYHEDVYSLKMVLVNVKTDEKIPFLQLFENRDIKHLYPQEAEKKCLRKMLRKRPEIELVDYYHSDICKIKKNV